MSTDDRLSREQVKDLISRVSVSYYHNSDNHAIQYSDDEVKRLAQDCLAYMDALELWLGEVNENGRCFCCGCNHENATAATREVLP